MIQTYNIHAYWKISMEIFNQINFQNVSNNINTKMRYCINNGISKGKGLKQRVQGSHNSNEQL